MNAEIDTVIEATQQTEEEVKKFRGMKISIQCYNLLLLKDDSVSGSSSSGSGGSISGCVGGSSSRY